MLSLTKMNVMPPGGYYYKQPETGMVFSGNEQFKAQAMAILAHRKGNRLARASFLETAEDLMAYTCARLPALCNATLPSATSSVPRSVRKCGACGGRKAAA